ncbi:LysE family translocator [Corticibacter populi]|uniref:LysE family translocator n=1 Tax=Corticibacter populi TaxID=1550736 RepID=A0A3M6QUH3_9BURK|nr:LysE family translocator [Corticibacter populi]RMX06685.1 LysE family translocator [Corticibacter populi]RZS31737.1 threonine/homoserine/homoserine lactone efflux protein [Corticibacter populi]
MPTFDSVLAFFGVAVLLALSPGPDNIFVLMQSAQHGWRAGMAVVLGLCLGLVVHTGAVALGLAAVVAASALAFTLIKLCGAAYLLWLAWGAWHAPALQQNPAAGAVAQPDTGALAMVGRGVVMNLSNPKVLLFFMAFLPQFANPARGPVSLQIMVFGAVFMLAALLVFGSIACCSGWFGRVLQTSAGAQRVLNRLASAVFVALAARLASLSR